MKFLMIMSLFAACLFSGECGRADTGSVMDEYVPDIHLDISLDLQEGMVHGDARVMIPAMRRLEFMLGGIDDEHVLLAGHDIDGSLDSEKRLIIGPLNNSRELVIRFTKKISIMDMSARSANYMRDDAAVLLEEWYPRYAGLARYTLQATLPAGMEAISEADSVNRTIKDGFALFSFDFPYPREEVTLVAGRYIRKTEVHCGIEIETCFFPEDQGLAHDYMEKLKYYIDLYRDILPPYPFKRFAVVENILPTGFGMPTYTLLGQQVVRLPFIKDTSLGHEFVHSWFGNSVYVDMSRGNWCEGLTTFMADALYMREKGRGEEYRHRLLTEYQAYVHAANAVSLREFSSQRKRAGRAVGYGKAAMIFHMLQQETGDDVFRRAVQRLVLDYRFRKASWEDIQEIFSREYGSDLDWFFQQWLSRRDVPRLDFSKVTIQDAGDGKNKIMFTVVQKNEVPYRLTLPLVIHMPDRSISRDVVITSGESSVTFDVNGKPFAVTADPGFDVMRQMSAAEYPPVLARVFGAEKKFFYVQDNEQAKYDKFIKFLVSKGFVRKKPEGHGHAGYRQGAFVIMGQPEGPMKMLAGDVHVPEDGLEIRVKGSPLGSNSVICTVQASSTQELQGISARLPHLGRYSFLKFSRGKLKEKSTAFTVKGIRLEIRKGIDVIASRDIFAIRKLVRYISGDRVIYVGEQHDRAGHHSAQLGIIKLLHQRGVKLAVGMEMFQRQCQAALDRYIAGDIDERRFLHDSEYFRRWGFDYHLYRPIIEYCRKEHIPVIALNLSKEISARIARHGLNALSVSARAQLPDELDTSCRPYRERLQDIFSQHVQPDITDFENFFQAQVGWDETMAWTISDYLEQHDDLTMVVLAGAGHIAYGFGIPSRVARRLPGIDYSIILNEPGDDMQPEAGDFFLFPPDEKVRKAPKLGIMLSDAEEGLEIKQVMPGSPAEKGGVKSGDVLKAFDSHPVHDINDLKLELFFKKLGDRAKLTIMRDNNTIEIETGAFNSTSFNFRTPHGHGGGTGMMKHGNARGMP